MSLLFISFALFALALSGKCPPTHEVIPGSDRLRTGFDAAKLQFLDLPVWSWNYCKDQTWSPPNHPELVYSLPDELFYNNEDKEISDSLTSICYHFDETVHIIAESFYVSIDIGIPMWAGIAFNYDKETYHAWAKMHDKLNVQAFSLINYEMFTLESAPPFMMDFDPTFSLSASRLPKTLDSSSDVRAYVEFIDHWGTHYAYYCKMGGKVHLDTWVDSKFFATKSVEWVSTQISLDFWYKMFDISPGYFHNKSEIHIDKEFKKHSQSMAFFVGGDTQYQTLNTLKEWKDSIVTHPDYINCSMDPLYTVFSDAAVQANYKKVADFYIKNGCFPSDEKFRPCAKPTPKPTPPK